ncbi:MAG: LacI family transcriptional regulator [Chloroflexota bacterium]|nr:MAG: LacI family transcriptional regulator [Chloroflexota bacterium]
MPNILDVARRAGVAPITVSRVINNSGYFSEEIRQRVESAIKELGYVPNTLARSLRSKKTNTLALVLTDITNPFFTVVARGVEDTASDAGFMVIYCNTDESEIEEEKYVQMLLQKQVDGILLVPARSEPTNIANIKAKGTPVVVIDRRIEGIEADVVRCDSEGGAYQLTQLLLDMGHRHIAVLSGPQHISTAADRVAGYRRAMTEAGMSSNECIYFGNYHQKSGYEMARQALAVTPRPTAFFTANNFIAVGALNALQEAGLCVPEDFSLVTFDDLPPTLTTYHFLTAIAQPAYEMGKKAMELLLARLNPENVLPYQEVVLPTELVIRQSSGRAPGKISL